MTDWIHNTELAVEKRKQGAGIDMELQKEGEKAEGAEEDFKIKGTLFLASGEDADEFTPEELERLAEAGKQGAKAGAELRRKL